MNSRFCECLTDFIYKVVNGTISPGLYGKYEKIIPKIFLDLVCIWCNNINLINFDKGIYLSNGDATKRCIFNFKNKILKNMNENYVETWELDQYHSLDYRCDIINFTKRFISGSLNPNIITNSIQLATLDFLDDPIEIKRLYEFYTKKAIIDTSLRVTNHEKLCLRAFEVINPDNFEYFKDDE